MSEPVAKLVVEIGGRTEGLRRAMAQASSDVKLRTGDIIGALDRVRGVAGTVLGAGIVASLSGVVSKTVDAFEGFNDLADATGASIENISALDRIAREAGGTFDGVASTLVKFNELLAQTQDKSGKASGMFKAIGLDAAELRRLDPAEALMKTAVALEGYADNGEKARFIQVAFGKSVKEVAPLLKDLADKGVLVASATKEQVENADRFSKALARMRADSEDFGRSIATRVLPVLGELVAELRDSNGIEVGTNALKGLVFIGAEVAHAFKRVGIEAGGALAQIAAVGRLDFQGFAEIARAVREDATKARNDTDEFLRRVAGSSPAVVATGRIPAFGLKMQAAPSKERDGRPRLTWSGADGKGGKDRQSEEERLATQGKALADSLFQQSAALSGDFLEKWNKLGAARKAGLITVEQLVEAQRELLIQQPFMREAAAAATKEALAKTAAYEREMQAQQAALKSLAQANFEAAQEAELIGLSEQQHRDMIRAREDGVIALKQEQLARLDSFELEGRAAEQLMEEIRLLKERRSINDQRSVALIGEERKKETAEYSKQLESDLKGAFTAAFASTKNPIRSFGESIASTVSQRLSASLADSLAKVLQESLGAGAGSGLGSLVKSVGSWLGTAFGFADGGIMTSAGPVALKRYANGGVAATPQLALFGEGRTPEAFVPLPDGRRIPVAMQGGGGSIVIQIDARGADAGVETRLRAMLPEIKRQVVAEVQDRADRGGNFARSMGRRR